MRQVMSTAASPGASIPSVAETLDANTGSVGDSIA